jgi:hypothetical protein
LSAAKRVSALALIGISWFCRDYFATEMDKESVQLQQALTESANQEQRNAQNRDQRQAMHLLRSIKVQLAKDDSEQEAADYESAKGDIVALGRSAEQFTKLNTKTMVEGRAHSPKLALANGAIEVYKKLAAEDWEPDQALVEKWQNEKEWTKLESDLSKAFDALAEVVSKEAESSGELAAGSRYIAWAFTALGGLLIGDWRKLLAGPSATEDDGSAAATETSS